ncbi:MAG: DUF935 family protein [Pseudomonadota bacterium]
MVRAADLNTEIATPTRGGPRSHAHWRALASLTPTLVASILRRAAQGDGRDFLLAADEIAEKDLHYRAVLQSRCMAVSALPLLVDAADDTPAAHEAAELVRAVLAELPMNEVAMHLMGAVAKGYAVAELVWDTRRQPWRPRALLPRPAHWFAWTREGAPELRLLSAEQPFAGEPLPAARFVVHALGGAGLPLQQGVARAVLWAWVVKAYALRDWARFAELYGQPIRIGKYDPAATPQDVDVLKEAVLGLGADAAAVIPQSMMLELVEAAGKTASADLYQKLIEYLDRAVSKAVLGQTLTTDQGATGSLAQARVHDDVRKELLAADARALAATLTRDLAAPLVRLNLGEAAPLPRLRFEMVEPDDLDGLSLQVARLVALGLPVPQGWARQKWGIPEPDGDEPLLTPPAQATNLAAQRRLAPAVPALGATRGVHGQVAHAAEPPAAPDAIDALIDEAMAGWHQQMGPVLAPLEQLFARAEREGWSAAELLDALAPTLAQPDEAQLTEALARAAYSARIGGTHGLEAATEGDDDA